MDTSAVDVPGATGRSPRAQPDLLHRSTVPASRLLPDTYALPEPEDRAEREVQDDAAQASTAPTTSFNICISF